jgi:fructokinase
MGIRIGIDVGGTKIEGVALDGSVERVRLRVDTPRGDYAATLDAIAGVVSAPESRVPHPNPGRPSRDRHSGAMTGGPPQRHLDLVIGQPLQLTLVALARWSVANDATASLSESGTAAALRWSLA